MAAATTAQIVHDRERVRDLGVRSDELRDSSELFATPPGKLLLLVSSKPTHRLARALQKLADMATEFARASAERCTLWVSCDDLPSAYWADVAENVESLLREVEGARTSVLEDLEYMLEIRSPALRRASLNAASAVGSLQGAVTAELDAVLAKLEDTADVEAIQDGRELGEETVSFDEVLATSGLTRADLHS